WHGRIGARSSETRLGQFAEQECSCPPKKPCLTSALPTKTNRQRKPNQRKPPPLTNQPRPPPARKAHPPLSPASARVTRRHVLPAKTLAACSINSSRNSRRSRRGKWSEERWLGSPNEG